MSVDLAWCLVLSLFGLRWISRRLLAMRRARRLRRAGVETLGRIIDLEVLHEGWSSQSDGLRFVYAFEAEKSGREQRFTGVKEGLSGSAMLVGHPVRIRFLPDDPDVSMVEEVVSSAPGAEPVEELDVPDPEEIAAIEAQGRRDGIRLGRRKALEHLLQGSVTLLLGFGMVSAGRALATDADPVPFALIVEFGRWFVLGGMLILGRGMWKLVMPRSS